MATGKDVFGYLRNPKPDGVFSSEDSTLTIAGTSATASAYLVQNWNVQYQQQVDELYEIGSNRLYWSKGHPIGSGTIGRIVGANKGDMPGTGLFPKEAYDMCDGGATMTIKAQGGHCDSSGNASAKLDKGVNLSMSGCVITSIGFSMSVADVRLVEQYGWRFGYLNIT